MIVVIVTNSGDHTCPVFIDRLPGLASRVAYAKQSLCEKLINNKLYIRRYGDDMPEIKDWSLGGNDANVGAASTGGDNV
jgi:xylulose-5-phosphate/fructose-6-phosphate phosphoketolase